jgi:hypothetical protein
MTTSNSTIRSNVRGCLINELNGLGGREGLCGSISAIGGGAIGEGFPVPEAGAFQLVDEKGSASPGASGAAVC